MKDIMRNRLYIIALFSIIAVLVKAQPSELYNPVNNQPIQSQQIIKGGANYQSVVYEPFTNAAPSEYSESEEGTVAKAPGIRSFGNFDDVPEGGEQENTYPLGDAVLPLLVMAMVSAGVIALRRRKNGITG